MVIFNSYKINLFLNRENIKYIKNYYKFFNNLNYIFNHKTKFIRNFIYLYSIFLISNQNSFIYFKNTPQIDINLNTYFLLFLNDSYKTFF